MNYKNITVDEKLFNQLEFLKDKTLYRHGKRNFTWPATLRFLLDVFNNLPKELRVKVLEGA